MKKESFRSYITNNMYTIICCAVIIGAFIVTCMISFLSEFGVHPDEFDVRVCLDWCEDRLFWPDMRLEGEGLGDTYSGYGYTKVCNYTPYFLIFSKISFVFKQFMDTLPYFRMPNLLLMLFMTLYMLRFLKKHDYLMLGFGICVQAWYIFSYVTADAQDFVVAFLVIALLADKESYLWRILDTENRTSGFVPECILLGLLYGISMLGKPYYYAGLALTFIVLIRHLIKSEFNNRRQLLARYLIIAGVTFAVFLGRCAVDVYYYGFDKAEVKTQMAEKWSDPDKNPLTPESELAKGWKMHSRGYGIKDMFEEEPDWFGMSFRSFAGARITRSGHDFYFYLMGILYAAIFGMIAVYLCREKKIFILVSGILLSITGIVASILNSYLVEIQPQGRYLLPIALTTCYLSSQAEGLWKNKAFKAVVIAAACLSVAYFGLFETRELIDLSYVRELL